MTPTKEHGSIGHNVKVHFAGTENVEFGYITHEAGSNYFLFTVLPFIMDQFGIKWGRITFCKNMFPWIELPKLGKHVIMDSGLFSLMFGACKDVRPDEKFIRRYKDAICNFVNEMNLDRSIACVECDCQKLLGTELAWELREQMRKQIPNTIMAVYGIIISAPSVAILNGCLAIAHIYRIFKLKKNEKIQKTY